MTDFTYINPESVSRTGFHGWLQAGRKEVVFCRRTDHLFLVEKGSLDGVDGDLLHTPEHMGGPRRSSLMETKLWVARKGWVHFVSHPDREALVFVPSDQFQKDACRDLCRELNLECLFNGPNAPEH